MPCVSRFYGIAIYLYANDHNPPHFHAKYSGDDAAIVIQTLEILAGELPSRAASIVREWAVQHRPELLENWNRLMAGQDALQIEPLP